MIILAFAAAALAACNKTEPTGDSARGVAVDGWGAVLITEPGGMQKLRISSAGGTFFEGPFEGDPAVWSKEGGKGCLDLAGDQPKFCFTLGNVREDGTWVDTTDDGSSVVLRQINKDSSADFARIGAGSFLLNFPDGSSELGVWAKDGKAYFAQDPQAGVWRVKDGKRCWKLTSADGETCRILGAQSGSGSFLATPEDLGAGPSTFIPLDEWRNSPARNGTP